MLYYQNIVLSFGSMDEIKVYWTEIEPKGETMQSTPSLFPWHPFNSCYLSNMFNEFLFISSVFCTGWTLKLAAGTDTFSLKWWKTASKHRFTWEKKGSRVSVMLVWRCLRGRTLQAESGIEFLNCKTADLPNRVLIKRSSWTQLFKLWMAVSNRQIIFMG